MKPKHDCAFIEGDVVQFKIGGPKMLIDEEPRWIQTKVFTNVGYWLIHCKWWQSPVKKRVGYFRTANFNEEELKKA